MARPRGFTFYEGPRDSQLLANARADFRARERDAQIAAAAGVDSDGLTVALAERLAAVAPPEVRIDTTERDMVYVLDVRGGGAGIDIAFAVATPNSDSRVPANRVVDASQRLLEAAQEEIAEVTTDPWPRRGSGTLPEPHAELSQDSMAVRLFWGSVADPVLELDALSIADYLSSRSRQTGWVEAAGLTPFGFPSGPTHRVTLSPNT